MASETTESREKSLNFLEEIIEESIAKGETRVQTRFPPEPNGYLHIGHAKSICINFGLAKKYGGKCNLRFDDTNPVKEDVEYVDSIKRDIHWLGFDWAQERYASDYFDQLYEWALVLIKKGLAYVDDQTQEQIRENRGTVSVPGTPSPWRDRSVEENLDLFQRMKAGEFPDGAKVLRAKIDMAHPNMLFRDPIMYRIIHAEHHRTGNKWCIPSQILSILASRRESRRCWSLARRALSFSQDIKSIYILYCGSELASSCPSAEKMLPRSASTGTSSLTKRSLTASQ